MFLAIFAQPHANLHDETSVPGGPIDEILTPSAAPLPGDILSRDTVGVIALSASSFIMILVGVLVLIFLKYVRHVREKKLKHRASLFRSSLHHNKGFTHMDVYDLA